MKLFLIWLAIIVAFEFLVRFLLFSMGSAYTRWMDNGRNIASQSSVTPKNTELRCSKHILIHGVVLSIVSPGIAILCVFTVENLILTSVVTAIFLFSSVLGLLLILVHFSEYDYDMSDEELIQKKIFGKNKHIKWSEIERVSYINGSFHIKTKKVDIVEISLSFIGLPAFAELLLKHVSREAIEAESLDTIKNIAKGELPSIYETLE